MSAIKLAGMQMKLGCDEESGEESVEGERQLTGWLVSPSGSGVGGVIEQQREEEEEQGGAEWCSKSGRAAHAVD